MFGWWIVDAIFGVEMQLAQSRVGKTLLSRIIFPPTLASRSTRRTLNPISPRFRADSIPPMPLPRTRTYPSATSTPRNAWPTFADHAPMSLLVTGSLDQISMMAPTGTVPMPFFASRRGPGQAAPRASTTLSAVMASSSDSVMVAGMVPFSLVDEAVGRGGDLGDESTGGHDFGAFDKVRGGDSAAVHTRCADEQGPAELPEVPQELCEGREAGRLDAVCHAHADQLHAVGLEAQDHLDV